MKTRLDDLNKRFSSGKCHGTLEDIEKIKGNWNAGPYGILGEKKQYGASPMVWKFADYQLFGVTPDGKNFSSQAIDKACVIKAVIPWLGINEFDKVDLKFIFGEDGSAEFFITKYEQDTDSYERIPTLKMWGKKIAVSAAAAHPSTAGFLPKPQ